MKKPKAKTVKLLDFSECRDFIEKKHKIDTRDYAGSHGDFSRWCKQVGEKVTPCPPGCSDKVMKAHQAQFARYQADIKSGKFQDRPYQDFWHFLIDRLDVQRGGTIELDEELKDGAEDWQKIILDLYLTEFGKGPYRTDW